ncbi:MAG: replicative DNA helicase [Xanthomonadales bacterium]|nr:replicative DNA helicase [Xanthomonadales bacterium]
MERSSGARTAGANVRSLRLPPHSIDAEQAVLGALMLDESAWHEVADLLVEDDFYREDHRLIFAAVAELARQQRPADVVTVGDFLRARDRLESVGGSAYLAELAAGAASAANARAYAEIVREKALLRRLIEAATRILDQAYDPAGREAREVIEEAEQAIYQVSEKGERQGTAVELRQAVVEAFAVVERRFNANRAVIGLPTGFHDLDQRTAGLQDGDLVIVAARPSMGKTAFALNIAEHAALAEGGCPVAIFSMEMSAVQITMRLLSSNGRIDQSRLRTGRLEDEDWPRLSAAVKLLSKARIFIDETPSLSPVELRARARRLKAKHGIGLVVVDYLQLMHVPGTRENRATEISEISRSLKALAKELGLPVVALSQLNRQLEGRQDKRPMMADLRESGAIEQDADLILFIYRDEYYHPESPERGIAEIIIGKHRNGPTGTVRLAFRELYTRFDNLAREDEFAGGPP